MTQISYRHIEKEVKLLTNGATPSTSLYPLTKDSKSKLSLNFIPGPFSIVATTKQGLLLCVNDYNF
ncbi:hypothetical protein CFP56_020294 [Quercus suber]|uniref:Uncharacterized protein n=1 Tax=Quercus suber TaxID=58331 RepID=A0AAW0KF83_QUESU